MPRRPGRLRPAAERVLRLDGGSTPTSASPATTTSACSGRSTSRRSRPTRPRPRAGRGACSSDDAREYLAALEPSARARGRRRSTTAARATRSGSTSSRWEAARRRDRRVAADAHARRPQPRAARDRRRPRLDRRPRAGRHRESTSGGRWLLNPGSVGQPRDGDPDAAWLLLDLDARHASFRRVAVRRRADAGGDPRRRVYRMRWRSASAHGV